MVSNAQQLSKQLSNSNIISCHLLTEHTGREMVGKGLAYPILLYVSLRFTVGLLCNRFSVVKITTQITKETSNADQMVLACDKRAEGMV